MDPIAALGLAGNVAQFIDLGCKVFSMAGELYRSASGRLVEDVQLQSASEALSLLTSLQVSRTSFGGPAGQNVLSPAEQELLVIADSCRTLTKEIQEAFDFLRLDEVKDTSSPTSPKSFANERHRKIYRRIDVFRVVSRRTKKSGEIDRLSKRLDGLRGRFTICLLSLVK